MKRQAQSCKVVFAAGFFFLAMMGIAGQAYGAPQPTFVYVTAFNSAGTGMVFGYALDSITGALNPVPGSPFAAGFAPSRAVAAPSNKFVYVENYNNISEYTVDG